MAHSLQKSIKQFHEEITTPIKFIDDCYFESVTQTFNSNPLSREVTDGDGSVLSTVTWLGFRHIS